MPQDTHKPPYFIHTMHFTFNSFKGRFHQQVERVHLGENAIIPLPSPATEQIWSRPRRIERVQLVGETGP